MKLKLQLTEFENYNIKMYSSSILHLNIIFYNLIILKLKVNVSK